MAQTIERKDIGLKLEAVTDSGVLEGYASVKHDIDSYGDRIMDGAYSNIDEFVKDGFVAVGHDHYSIPVAMVLEAREDDKGLWVKAQFHDTQAGQDARKMAKERMDAGKSVGLSIGYVTLDYERKKEGDVEIRELKAIELKEFSLVTMPAAKRATATSVKGETGSRLEDQVKHLLAEAEDLTTRMETFATDRKQGLSETNQKRCQAVIDRLGALLVKDDEPLVVNDSELVELAPTW